MRRSSSSPDRVGHARGGAAAALRSREFRWLLVSHSLGSLGLWTHRTALIWFTVVVTDGDAPSVGLVTALQYAPMWLSAFGGGLGDRWRKRTVLIVNQVVAATACAALSLAALLWEPGVAVLGTFAVVLGVCAAVEAPVRLAYPREIVDVHLVRGAIGLNGVVFQASRIVGPAVAGLGIAAFGESVGFACAALCAACSVGALLGLRELAGRTAEARGPESWRRTIGRVWEDPALLAPIAGATVVGACLINLQIWLPLVVGSRGADAGEYGVLLAAVGAGGVVGALIVSSLPVEPSVRSLGVGLALQASVTGVTALMPVSSWLVVWVFVTGVLMQAYNTSAITVLQSASPNDAQGRIMGLYVVSYFVWAGAGAPLFGLLAQSVGPRAALLVSSVAALAVALLLAAWSMRQSRRSVVAAT